MDDKRKRYLTAGVLVGVVTVGLLLLARKTPRDQWSNTLARIARDVLAFVKGRYGSNPAITIAEKTLDRFEANNA